MIAVKSNIKSSRRNGKSSCEDLWVTVEVTVEGKSNHIAICAVYLPPPIKNNAVNDFLINTSKIINNNDQILLIGDLNLSSML